MSVINGMGNPKIVSGASVRGSASKKQSNLFSEAGTNGVSKKKGPHHSRHGGGAGQAKAPQAATAPALDLLKLAQDGNSSTSDKTNGSNLNTVV